MFYEMVRDGFIEQMQSMNDEINKTQTFSTVLTKWIFENFKVKLFKTMSGSDL